MSYDSIERSNHGSKPINLYEFSIGSTYWRYSSDEVDTPFEDPLHGPVVFKAVAISDSGVVQVGDTTSGELTINLPSTTPIALLFNATPPSDETWLVLRRKQHDEDNAPVIWIGTVSSFSQTALKSSKFVCKTMVATFNRNGLRLSYGRQCPHSLYDISCRANKNAHGVVVQIDEIGGNWFGSADLAGYDYGWFSNGFIEFQLIGGATERRAIEHFNNAYVFLIETTDGLIVGDYVVVFPGCNRTTSDCINKFNNLSNFGGFPHLPSKSPFDGDPVF